jgi:ubiquinone/menaquinone biosynthesis C-methylase UbiE
MKKPASALTTGVLLGFVCAAAAWRFLRRRPDDHVNSGSGAFADPEAAQAYSRLADSVPMRIMRRIVARRAAHLVPSGQVLDLGCGPGFLAIELARRNVGIHVTGVDLSPGMLQQATRNAANAGMTAQTDFQLGDAQQMTVPDASIDLVMSTLSLHHWEQPVAALDEIACVLRPGGSYLLVDFRRDMPAPAWAVVWLLTSILAPRVLTHAHDPVGIAKNAYTRDEVEAFLRKSRLTGWCVSQGPFWLAIEGSISQ